MTIVNQLRCKTAISAKNVRFIATRNVIVVTVESASKEYALMELLSDACLIYQTRHKVHVQLRKSIFEPCIACNGH